MNYNPVRLRRYIYAREGLQLRCTCSNHSRGRRTTYRSATKKGGMRLVGSSDAQLKEDEALVSVAKPCSAAVNTSRDIYHRRVYNYSVDDNAYVVCPIVRHCRVYRIKKKSVSR